MMLAGRFSVFSAVGLVPFALVGIDIDEIIQGVKGYGFSFEKYRISRKILLLRTL